VECINYYKFHPPADDEVETFTPDLVKTHSLWFHAKKSNKGFGLTPEAHG